MTTKDLIITMYEPLFFLPLWVEIYDYRTERLLISEPKEKIIDSNIVNHPIKKWFITKENNRRVINVLIDEGE